MSDPPCTKLRKARFGLRLTQRQLAGRLGVTAMSVSLWESGRTVPRPAIRVRLARVLGLDPWASDRAAA